MRKIIGNILSLMISLTICFFVIEIALRIFAPQITVCKINYDWRKDDDVLPYVPKLEYKGRMVLKDQFDVVLTTNSDGFRGNKDFAKEKIQETKRIAFIGDSFTFGWGVEDEEAFAAILGNKLKTKSKDVEALNAAVYGYDIVQYSEMFNRVLEYNPDIIFLGFCLENDFNITPLKSGVDSKESIRVERTKISSRIRSFINNLHIVAMVRDRLYITFPKIRNLMLSLGINNKRDIFLKKYPGMLTLSLKETERRLDEMKRICQLRGIRFVVILIPLKEQIYCRDEINKFLEYDIDKPNRVMENILERRGIEYIDLLPYLVEEGKRSDNRLYFDTDPHWTAYGHDKVAKILYDIAIKRGYLSTNE
ncbi:MAG: SGNH/GDSL hydrolase family protein [Candidatus Omnitrophica bacterium]|nr:SGNH/GDSL hydrolase family protein [Candidatus Omnitrophota bacterium]